MEAARLKAKRLDNLISYMGRDGDYDPAKLENCYTAAKIYLTGAGVHDPMDADPAPESLEPGQYDLVLNGIAMFFYDHPDVEPTVMDFPIAVRLNLNQLKLSSPEVSL